MKLGKQVRKPYVKPKLTWHENLVDLTSEECGEGMACSIAAPPR